MKKTLLCLSFLLTAPLAFAQKNPPETQAILSTINRLFEGMRKGDSTAVRTVFYKNATMQSIFTDKAGNTILSPAESIDGFVKAIGTPHPDVYDERLSGYEVKMDGSLATAWTPYTFYLGKKLLHGGVDAFTLFKTPEGWKIINITDTRRTP